MALLGHTQLGLAALILTTFLGLSSIGEGVKQELWLYADDGNALYFQNQVPDLTIHSSFLPKITRKCEIGKWVGYETANYKKHASFGDWQYNGELICSNISATNLKSLRHWGASDTLTHAVSLYQGEDWDGEEIFVDTKAKTGISIPIRSLAATGNQPWLIYEGKNLDGDSICYNVPNSGLFSYNRVKDPQLDFTTIGSVFRGCDRREVELYKKLNFV